MPTFGPLTVVDPRTAQPIPGKVARVVDATTGDPVATYDTDGNPRPVVTGSRGQVAQFRADASIIDILVDGGDPSRLTALELLGNVGEVHQTITTGRLSEASLLGTIETAAVAPARQAATEYLAEQGAVVDAAATRAVSVAADPAVAGTFADPTSATRTEANKHYAGAAFFQRRPASAGALTDGDLIRVGRHAYSADVGGTTYVQGGATNQENVIGGNIAAVRTTGSNLDPAVMNDGANRSWSAILHGYDNVNNGWANIFAGYHLAAETLSNHVTLLGGVSHYADATCQYGTAIGGLRARLAGIAAIVAGGEENEATADHATVAGGARNKATGTQAHIIGGQYNEATGHGSGVAGGRNNKATGVYSRVASGQYNTAGGDHAVIAGGQTNTTSAAHAFIGTGLENQNSGQYAFVGSGYQNRITANYGVIMGGRESSVTATYGTVVGRNAVANLYGANAHSAGQFAAQGDAQTQRVILRRETTTATPTELGLDGTANVAGRLAIPGDTTWAVTGTVVARRIDGTAIESAAWRVSAVIQREGWGMVGLIGTPKVEQIAASVPTWTVELAAGTATGSLIIRGVGEAGNTIRWVASLEIVQVGG